MVRSLTVVPDEGWAWVTLAGKLFMPYIKFLVSPHKVNKVKDTEELVKLKSHFFIISQII